MKLILICPKCGGSNWIRSCEEEGDFECTSCRALVFPEDMDCRTDQEDPEQ